MDETKQQLPQSKTQPLAAMPPAGVDPATATYFAIVLVFREESSWR